jgi:putrescine transport system substrate-binding protein
MSTSVRQAPAYEALAAPSAKRWFCQLPGEVATREEKRPVNMRATFGTKGLALLALGLMLPAATLAVTAPAFAQEKVVNVFNWSDYIEPAVLEEFTKETGIKVKYDVFDSNEMLETKLLAGKSGNDVVVPTGGFLARQIKAGVFQKLDKSKLPNIKNMWPLVMERLSKYDPGNEHAVNYMWGTTGVGINVKKIKEIMPDAPIDSARMLFDPEIVSKFKKCGIMMLDAADEIIPPLMNYLGLSPNSTDPEDFKKAAEHFAKIRPNIRKFHSSEYINAIANGDVCLVYGWSGDFSIAKTRAEEKNKTITDEAKKIEISYSIPKEGTLMWFDNMAIPADAPNADNAHKFIDFMMRPDVIARSSNFIGYANGNLESQSKIDKSILDNPNIYPPKATVDKLWSSTIYDKKAQRALTDAWRKMKRG